MKLKKKQKDNIEKKLVQNQYPKVKTFSKAYDHSPVSSQVPASGAGFKPSFAPYERPYPVNSIHGTVPEGFPDSSDPNDPERIDLQDTILTDESFVERSPRRRLQEKVPVMDAAEEGEKPDETRESEETDEPEGSYSSGYSHSESKNDWFEPIPLPEPEAEFESDPFYSPEDDPEPLPDFRRNEEPASETDKNAVSFFETDADPGEPFSWFSSDKDDEEDQDEKTSLEFKKKKYTVKLKKKTNLKKKLRSKPKGSLKWKSSNEKIAKISRKGVLKPKKKGKITVRVKSKDGDKAKVRIRIKKAKKQNAMSWASFGTGKKGFF